MRSSLGVSGSHVIWVRRSEAESLMAVYMSEMQENVVAESKRLGREFSVDAFSGCVMLCVVLNES